MIKELEVKSITLAVTTFILILLVALIAYITFFAPESEPPRRSLPVMAGSLCSMQSSSDIALDEIVTPKQKNKRR